jgi:hypothetical protein
MKSMKLCEGDLQFPADKTTQNGDPRYPESFAVLVSRGGAGRWRLLTLRDGEVGREGGRQHKTGAAESVLQNHAGHKGSSQS